MATVTDLLADAIRRSTPAQPNTTVLGSLVTVDVDRDVNGVITGVTGVTVNVGGQLVAANGVLDAFNRSVIAGSTGGTVQCNLVGGQLIVADIVIPVGD